jgi:CheY-like chemotaxis protein
MVHDFNNLLMGILGNAELALTEVPSDSPAREELEAVAGTARKAARLCRELLAFTGCGQVFMAALDLGDLITQASDVLRSSVPRQIELTFEVPPHVRAVKADASQVRQALLNLVINAVEAVGEQRGRINVSVGSMLCDAPYLRDAHLGEGAAEGAYSYIQVTDDGRGMGAETMERVFDPFFTTKFAGRGLGLPVVLGIARAHHGVIKLRSAPNEGTTVRVLFPATDEPVFPAPRKPADTDAGAVVSGVVLLLEHDETVRAVGVRMLEKGGFTVLAASDSAGALDVFRDHASEIRCVILDLSPDIAHSTETFRRLREIRGDVPVIFSSSQVTPGPYERLAAEPRTAFIVKPYESSWLVGKILEISR